jgi:hypothetical protein
MLCCTSVSLFLPDASVSSWAVYIYRPYVRTPARWTAQTVIFKDQLHGLICTKSWRSKNATIISAHIAGGLNEIRTEFFSTVSPVGLVYCLWYTDLGEVLSRIKLNREVSEGLYSIFPHTLYACELDKYFSVSVPLLSMNGMLRECGLANLRDELHKRHPMQTLKVLCDETLRSICSYL